MKKTLSTALLAVMGATVMAQQPAKAFKGYLFNEEYEVYMKIDFYGESISVPGNELYGLLPGFLAKRNNNFCWAVTAAKIKDENTAEMSLINDFGSEDLTATLTRENDSIYILHQEKGSTLKVPKNGKWQKLPKTLPFKRQK